jgi:hypothetical protein
VLAVYARDHAIINGATNVDPAPFSVAAVGSVHPLDVDAELLVLNQPAAQPAPTMMTMTTTTAITA